MTRATPAFARHLVAGLCVGLLLCGGLLAPARTQGTPAGASGDAQRWWSFQPVRDPAAPPVGNTARAQNEIDRFVRARLEANGMTPPPQADRRTLIRRATFDLTGLPPTPEEVDAFLNDPSPDAYP